MKEMTARFCQRYNPAAVWKDCNPILAEGEMGVESDTRLFKFGNGVTPWRDLQYAVTGGGGYAEVDDTLTEIGKPADARAAGQRITALEEAMAKMNYDISFTFSIQSAKPSKKTTAEFGESFTDIVLKWTCSETPVSVHINGVAEIINPGQVSGEKIIPGPITTNQNWSFTGKGQFNTSVSKSASIKFYRCAYCGTYDPSSSIPTQEFLEKKCQRVYLTNGRVFSFKLSVPAGHQPFLAWPTSEEPAIGLVDGDIQSALTARKLGGNFQFPTQYGEYYQTAYSLWAFAQPPSEDSNWTFKIS